MARVMLFPLLNVLYFYVSTFRIMCAVPNMAVFCSSLILCSPGMWFTYFLSDSDGTSCPYVYWYHFRFYSVVAIIIIIIIIIVDHHVHYHITDVAKTVCRSYPCWIVLYRIFKQ